MNDLMGWGIIYFSHGNLESNALPPIKLFKYRNKTSCPIFVTKVGAISFQSLDRKDLQSTSSCYINHSFKLTHFHYQVILF